MAANMLYVGSVNQVSPRTIVPGQREPGSLTRFAVSPPAVYGVVDDTLDDATVADRRREGGGAPSERRPVRHSS